MRIEQINSFAELRCNALGEITKALPVLLSVHRAASFRPGHLVERNCVSGQKRCQRGHDPCRSRNVSDFTAAAINNGIRDRVVELIEAAPGFSVKERIRWVARALRLPFGRVQKYRYNRVTRIEAHEADQIRHYAQGYERVLSDYRKARAELAAATPRGLGWLVPPAEGEEE